ncbi:MAG: hypothetical protein ACE5HV_09735 [Acidobacteriota bacterium]
MRARFLPRPLQQSVEKFGLGVAFALLVLVPGARASGPTSWVQSSYADFKAGNVESVSIDQKGELRLAPDLELLHDTGSPYIWALDSAPDGTIYASVGSEGDIFRIRPGEEPELLFSVPGTVHAMRVGVDDYLYISTSPSGAIYRVPRESDHLPATVWFDPKQRYSWAMAFDSKGRLYLGTGDDGLIFAVSDDGKGETFYDSAETHVTALAVDGDDKVIAGTEDHGQVYRITPDGEVFVLFDSPLRQITDIVVSDEGYFVAGIGPGSKSAPIPAPGGANPRVPAAGTSEAGSAGPPGAASSLAGAVYLIRPDGLAEALWTSATDSVYSMTSSGHGVVIGTGPGGYLIRVESSSEASILQKVEAAQVTALKTVAGSKDLLLATSNLGKVYHLSSSFRSNGQYYSQVKDTETTSRWGRIRWRASTPPGTSIGLLTRTGNTENPDNTWSDWAGPYTESTGSAIDNESARFVQWKAELRTSDPSQTPVLQWVELVYVQRNLRPEITDFVVHPAGVVYRQAGSFDDSLPFGQLPPPVTVALAQMQGVEAAGSGANPPTGRSLLGRPFYMPGSQTFTWQATDRNGDSLAYTLSYRGEGESTWKDIAADVTETSYTWDTNTVPDGLYRVRIMASDAPSNPASEELEAQRNSESFVIDNTPPQLSGLQSVTNADKVRVSGQVSDAVSLIREIEYAIDGGEWNTVLTADGLADSRSERIDFSSVPLSPGEHTIVVRATDAALNHGAAKVVVVVK